MIVRKNILSYLSKIRADFRLIANKQLIELLEQLLNEDEKIKLEDIKCCEDSKIKGISINYPINEFMGVKTHKTILINLNNKGGFDQTERVVSILPNDNDNKLSGSIILYTHRFDGNMIEYTRIKSNILIDFSEIRDVFYKETFNYYDINCNIYNNNPKLHSIKYQKFTRNSDVGSCSVDYRIYDKSKGRFYKSDFNSIMIEKVNLDYLNIEQTSLELLEKISDSFMEEKPTVFFEEILKKKSNYEKRNKKRYRDSLLTSIEFLDNNITREKLKEKVFNSEFFRDNLKRIK